jgi:concanavalin A-like lectin/glucanase superfamily protein/Big-like domain-containing protein
MLLEFLYLAVQVAPTVTDMNPAPGSIQASPGTVTISFSQNIDPTSVSATTVTLIGRGSDGLYGTPDDVIVTPSSISVNGNRVTLMLGGPLPDDAYQIRLSSGLSTPATHSGLFGYWKLDEGAGTATADSSGNGRNGTLNGPAWTSGLFNGSLAFTPGVNKVDIDAGIIAPPWSASLWVNRIDSPGIESCLMDSPAALFTATSLRLEQFTPLNRVGITDYNVGDYSFSYIAPVGTWVHLTFIGNSLTSTSLYVNGVFTETMTHGINLYVYKLGGDKASSFQGTLDEVQVYSRALNASEVTAVAGLTGCIRSATGGLLDGEFSGSFPTGNGTGGGDFVATFNVSSTFSSLTAGGCGGLGTEILIPWIIAIGVRRSTRRFRTNP